MKKYRPDGWGVNPCEKCTARLDDEFGRYCDLSCGQYSAWCNREAGADAMLEALKNQGIKLLM